MAEKFIFQFDEQGLDLILQKVREFRQTIREVGQAGDLGDSFQRFFNQFIAGTRNSTKTITDLRQQVQSLIAELASPRFTSELERLRNFGFGDQLRDIAGLVPGLRPRGAATTGEAGQVQAEVERRATEEAELREQVLARINAAKAEEARLTSILVSEEARLTQETQRKANLTEFNNRLEATRLQQLRQIQELKPTGDRLRELLLQRQTNLLTRQRELYEQLAQAAGSARSEAPKAAVDALRQEEQLARRVAVARQAVAEAEVKVAAAREAASGAQLAETDRSLSTATEAERTAFLEAQTRLSQELNAASGEELAARRILVNVEAEREENMRRIAALEELGGGHGQTEILNRIRQVNDEYNKLLLNSENAVRGLVGPEFQQQLQQIEQGLTELGTKKILSPDEKARLADLTVQAKQLIDQFQRIPEKGIPLPLSREEIDKSFGLINRLLIGAARDFGRRFTATLQFAISGTLLFGAQRLVREFFDAAIEVERTFADISTSLEFDVTAERGTAEFERRLERVRRQVLHIADDLNALPTEVNEAAFQMVSRFQNVEAAMIATRAQILATRIATIDQAEALRALTAVAEAHSESLIGIEDTNDRQIAQAQIYAEALDFATGIQQRFGIAIEETLEGSAGLIEVLQGLGFAVEEVFGIVATTVRKTGQTGQQVTDALGRAFSQFNSEKIRNELLDLANTYESFTLAPGDFFEDGRRAFFRIVDQYQDLDADLRQRIAAIIGQRRETRFVAALLEGAGEGLIDEVIDIVDESAGAAENRLRVLLATVQGTIEGVSSEFQAFAQNLQQLGIITPLRLFLAVLEGSLKIINEILFKAIDLFELFDRIRIPILNWGLGDALKTMIGLVTAALSLKSIFSAIQKVAKFQGANTFLDILARFTGFGGRSSREGGAAHLAEGAIATGGFASFFSRARHADSLMSRLGSTMRKAFIAPFDLAIRAVAIGLVHLKAWYVALRTGEVTTIASTGAEAGLTAERLRGIAVTTSLKLRELGFLGILGAIGTGFKAAGGILLAFQRTLATVSQVVLAVIGAFVTLKSAIGSILSIIDRFFPGDFNVNEATDALKESSAAAGKSLTDTEAKMKMVTDRINELNDQLARGEGEWISFGTAFLGPLRDLFGGEAAFPGTTAAIREEIGELFFEQTFLKLAQVEKEINIAARRAAEGTQNIAEDLDPIRARLIELRDGLEEFDLENLTIGGEKVSRGEFDTRVAEHRRLIDDTADALSQVGQILGEYAEALTPEAVTRGLQSLRTRLGLGDITTQQALAEVQRLREGILEYRRQARGTDERPEVEKAIEAYRETRQVELELFQKDLQDRLELTQQIQDRRVAIVAQLQAQRAALAAAQASSTIGPVIAEQIQDDILDLERELVIAINEEAVARARFAVENARTFEDQREAYERLRRAIINQILQRQATDRGVSGGIVVTAEEESALASAENDWADRQLRQAQLVAKNAILRNRSALDGVAAIAATVAALRVELEWMRDRGVEREELTAKEIEISNAITQQRLAEADRRAAFFRLTAGVGDEISAAQAELRAAIDRLVTIQNAGGEETQEGYEAELAVLEARQKLVDLALRQADLTRRVASDLTDGFAQSLLDVQAAQEALRRASGSLEELEAKKALAEAESRAQREFYDRRVSDLDFLFRTDQIGQAQYISALRALQSGIDRTTRQGEELWREIELQIRGLTEDANQAFNIPTEIRLPTLFEVRRALAADSLGVNYQDNRQQDINIYVSDDVDVQTVIDAIDSTFGTSIDLEAQRLASGGAGITIGGF